MFRIGQFFGEIFLQSKMTDNAFQAYYKFRVSGKKFITSRDTLLIGGNNSFFSTIMNRNFDIDTIDGYIFVDRNPTYFGIILDYLRTSRVPQHQNIDLNFLNAELDFYNLGVPKLKHIYIYIESNIYGAILTFSGLTKEDSEKLTDEMRNEGSMDL
jgi:hypothetical protein